MGGDMELKRERERERGGGIDRGRGTRGIERGRGRRRGGVRESERGIKRGKEG
jgi:hypothetical protein